MNIPFAFIYTKSAPWGASEGLLLECTQGGAILLNRYEAGVGKPYLDLLRIDGSFCEDRGWHKAAARYRAFCEAHSGDRILYLELGVGDNTPVIIKYPFWKAVAQNGRAA